MKLTGVLRSPPVFHYWRDFGAGKKRRIPFYKQWYNIWRRAIPNAKKPDHTLKLEDLPPGSRIMNAEDFMEGHIDLLPDELINRKEKVVYDHPWPYNVQLDAQKDQPLMRCYDIETRFFTPIEDCQVLTNTLLETTTLKASPPFEPTDEHMDVVQRYIDWSLKGDGVLVRLPRRRVWPRIDQNPRASYGISKERKEENILNSISDFAQSILAQHFHRHKNPSQLDELLTRRSIAFPKCQVLFEREGKNVNLDLCIESLTVSKKPLPLINLNPQATQERELININPRTWKSLLEQSRRYTPDWSFSLPQNSHLHTFQLASRIKRDHRTEGEMMARSIVHAYGLARSMGTLNNGNILKEPIVLQAVGFEICPEEQLKWHFLRYQMNTINFDDGLKNQAWYSGPIVDLRDMFSYYLDFYSKFVADVNK